MLFRSHFGLKHLQDLPSIDEIKTMVESSVKKDELIGTKKIVDVPESGTSQGGETQDVASEVNAPQDGVTSSSEGTADVPETPGETTPSENEGNA